MNLKKIQKHLEQISEQLELDLPTNKEFLIIFGNLLRQFALQHIQYDTKYKDLNTDDANAVSLACIAYPDSTPLALLLQSHVIIKLSETFKEE